MEHGATNQLKTRIQREERNE